MEAETFQRWCGPAALASALGISRVEAARRILEVQPWAGPSCNLSSMARVAGRPRYKVGPVTSDAGSGRSRGLLSRPTVAQWIKAHPTGSYLVRASRHFYHVKDGRIQEDNGIRQLRARVTHYVPMD